MHFLAISLLTILAGTLLLARFKKESPGKFFNFIAWFFIVVGFLLFLAAIGAGICRMKHHPCCGQPEFRHEMMMKGCGPGMNDGHCRPMMMEKGMCAPERRCMPADSTMKCCPKHMTKDSTR